MIKEIVSSILIATAVNNTTVSNSARDNKNFTINPTQIQNITYDQNGNLETATYYQIKECTAPLNLLYATAYIKGYTYLSIDTVNQMYWCYTDYYVYVIYEDQNQNNFNYSSLQINLRGYLNPNTGLQPYYQDYYLYGTNSTINNVNSFIYADTYTYADLQSLRTTTIPDLNTNMVDTVGTNTTINLSTKYTTIKYRTVWNYDEIYDENENINTNIIPNMLATLNSVFSSTTTTYYWTIDVEYTQEVIDIPGLMFTILGMPFAWISTAFDLTLFPGTLYELHVADMFLALIGILILIVVIRKMLK